MCPFKLLTGVPCPGCGMTRAYLHLLKVTYKALFIFIHFLAHSFASVTCHFLEKPMVQSINQNRYFWLGLMIAVLGVYGYRMWHFFLIKRRWTLIRKLCFHKSSRSLSPSLLESRKTAAYFEIEGTRKYSEGRNLKK